MNETLQQFCQRILPAVQAGAEGKEIESRYLRAGDDWGTHTARMFLLDHEYRVAQPKATPLPITPEMWAMIDPVYKFAVLTKGSCQSKIVVFTSDKPEFRGDSWGYAKVEDVCSSPLAIDITGIVPELSLTERPSDDDLSSEYEDNDDFQLISVGVNVCSDPVCAALDEMIKSFIKAASDNNNEPRRDTDLPAKDFERKLKVGKESATHKIGKTLYKKVVGEWFYWDEDVSFWMRSTVPSSAIDVHADKIN